MEDYEQAVFDRMREWLEDKYLEELNLMSNEEIKEEFYLRFGVVEDVLQEGYNE